MHAADSVARDNLFRAILVEMDACVEMVIRLTKLPLQHRHVGGVPSDFTVPIDIEAIDAVDADIHLLALALAPAAGMA